MTDILLFFSCKLRKMLITYTTSLLKDQKFPVRSRVILTKIGIGYSFSQWNCCMTNVMSCSTDHSSWLIFQSFSFQDKQEDGHLVFLLRHFLSPGQSLDALTLDFFVTGFMLLSQLVFFFLKKECFVDSLTHYHFLPLMSGLPFLLFLFFRVWRSD